MKCNYGVVLKRSDGTRKWTLAIRKRRRKWRRKRERRKGRRRHNLLASAQYVSEKME